MMSNPINSLVSRRSFKPTAGVFESITRALNQRSIFKPLTRRLPPLSAGLFKSLKEFSPCLPVPDDPAVCTPERIVLYTLAFSFCGVRYPLSPLKVELLKHFGIHFCHLHPLAFMRIVHFELSCVVDSGEQSVPLFRIIYRLQSDGDWFTFAKRKDIVSLPCYSFMPTSTYLKEWKNKFIFVSASLILESLPLKDPKAVIEDSVPALSANETILWKMMYEHPTMSFNFPDRILAMGGLSLLYPVRPKAYCEKRVNPDMGHILEGNS
ncbi:hypothetical protein Hanom_Chr11g01033321 [Helianthus anomalus]